jgi:hypothetical protein
MTLLTQPDRPICVECGKNGARQNGVSKNGFKRWQKLCAICSKTVYTQNLKDSVCQSCGFEAQDRCQLCFVDGKTICQNCNALRLRQNKYRGLTADTEIDIDKIRL